ncbi:hypothetical protein CGLO_17194 [Colletotrichum gloeosporioides Cg-14]|uniref:Uncharacterized protein n=1 Tax=Colletotrichum gloeosporioides (strain Cg-14) TaxID=1237896 RepID=T0L760_COLGC|nr:hypothetical protein CGLO_17194 [Colletotrichum gloeosporioides Cg-14]
MKVYAVQERVELIKMEKGIVRMTLDEKASSEIDGQKLFELGSKKTEEWLEVVLNMLRGLQDVKKETIPSS